MSDSQQSSNDGLMSLITNKSQAFIDELSHHSLKQLVDENLDRCFQSFLTRTDSHAGAIWIVNPTTNKLVIAYNVGGQGHAIEGQIEQSLESGLVSKSFKEEQTICHQGMFAHREQSAKVDEVLLQVTAHQIATPFRMFGRTVGVLTAIQTLDAGVRLKTEWGFDETDIEQIEVASWVIGRLLEYNTIMAATD